MPSTSIIMRVITCTNFMVTSSALTFQVTVLYPGHKQVKADLDALRADHQRVLKIIEDSGLGKKRNSITEWLPFFGRFSATRVAASMTD